MNLAEEKNLAGCCGVFCGLCPWRYRLPPRYRSAAMSGCPGCKTLSLWIPCEVFDCCVKEKGFVTCAECSSFPCERNDPETSLWDDHVTRKVCLPNIMRIREVGLEAWLKEQSERREMLENLLADYDEGRSRSFYCIATALVPVHIIKQALGEARGMMVKTEVEDADRKSKAKILRSIIRDLASESNIDLKLRRKPRQDD